MTAVTTEFRYFPRLPREIQEMVWGYYDLSEPVTRHYFFNSEHGRCYVAMDAERGVLTSGLTKSKNPAAMRLDPASKTVFHKIQFTGGRVSTTGLSTPLKDMWELRPSSWARAKGKAPFSAYVNFDRDVFAFQNLPDKVHDPFRFLTVPIHSKTMMPSEAHKEWMSQIRRAAIYPPEGKRRYRVSWTEGDYAHTTDAIRHMTSLEKLYVVVSPQLRGCHFARFSVWEIPADMTKDMDGFVKLTDFCELHKTRRPRLFIKGQTKPKTEQCNCGNIATTQSAYAVATAIRSQLGNARVNQINIVDVVDPLYPGP